MCAYQYLDDVTLDHHYKKKVHRVIAEALTAATLERFDGSMRGYVLANALYSYLWGWKCGVGGVYFRVSHCRNRSMHHT